MGLGVPPPKMLLSFSTRSAFLHIGMNGADVFADDSITQDGAPNSKHTPIMSGVKSKRKARPRTSSQLPIPPGHATMLSKPRIETKRRRFDQAPCEWLTMRASQYRPAINVVLGDAGGGAAARRNWLLLCIEFAKSDPRKVGIFVARDHPHSVLVQHCPLS